MSLRERIRQLSPAQRNRLLAELKKRNLQLTPGDVKEDYTTIRQAEEQEYYPLSPSQKRFYILNLFMEYNVPTTMVVEGPLQKDRFQQAFQKLADRHESLRTSIILIDGEPCQKIHSHIDFKVDYHDFSHLDEESLRSAEEGRGDSPLAPVIDRIMARFDLSRAPLMRVGLVRLAPDKHLLLHNMHHIVSDGASKRILSNEFARLYEGQDLPEMPVQYRDYAEWQNHRLNGDEYRRHEDYWLSVFPEQERLPVLNLPTDYPRPPMQSFEGRRIPFSIDGETFQVFKQLSSTENASFYMVLQCIYNILLHRYSGQEDIVTGTVTAGRLRPEVQPLLGIFINPLALRNFPSSNKTFREFLRDLKQRTLEAYDHQSFPFGDLLEKVVKKKDHSRNPLFDALIILHNMFIDVGRPRVGGVEFLPYEPKHKPPGHAQQDLALLAVETRDSIDIEIEYCTALFKPDTIQRMAGHYLTLLRDAAAHPDRKLSELEILPQREKELILQGFNDTAVDFPGDITFTQLFEEQVLKFPENIAVVDPAGGIDITYTELNRRAAALSSHLIQRGIQPGDIVALQLERGIEIFIAILAVFKSGAAYLPIDPDYPEERIRYMLRDSQSRITLTIDDINPEHDSSAPNLTQPVPGGAPLQPAYIIFTSGTTGKPRGVMVDHGNLMNAAYGWIREYGLDSMPVNLLQMASFSFDVFAGDLARGLLTGGKIVICPAESRIDPPVLYDLIHEYRVSLFESTPSLIIPLMQYVYDNRLPIDSLELLILGSDACPVEDFRRLLERFGDSMRIINSYGLTETTIDSGFYQSLVEHLPATGNVPIGKPLPNTEYYILDTHGNPQPIGIPGELYIAGKGVSCGYLNNPELTNHKFSSLQNKSFWESRTLFTKSPSRTGSRYPAPRGAAGGNLYKSGDLCRWVADGNVEFLGRIDNQVKLRGLRVELGEIENVILQYPGVKDAVVVDRVDEAGEKYLCAYYVSVPGQSESIGTDLLRDYLSGNLPGYMVPARYMQLEKIPLTPNGKVDRNALPEVDQITGVQYIAPRNQIEEKLVQLWSRILDKDAGGISIEDNFFYLGGHSIRAMRLLSAIRETFGVRISLVELFRYSTVRVAADLIRQRQSGGVARSGPAIVFPERQPREQDEHFTSYEASSAQKRLHSIDTLQGSSTLYNEMRVWGIEGQLEPRKLKTAVETLARRHEILRTGFVLQEGETLQRVYDEIQVDFQYIQSHPAYGDTDNDPNNDPDNDPHREQAIEQVIRDFQSPFDLSRPPLWKIQSVQWGENRQLLLFDFHHIIADGGSMEIIVRELTELYMEKTLPESRIQFVDFTAWQNRLFRQEYFQKQEQYWLDVFREEVPVLDLPTDYPRSGETRIRGSNIIFDMDPQLSQRLQQFTLRHNTTLYTVLLAVTGIWLSRYSRQEDIVIGTPISGRPSGEFENMIGMFVNTLAMRIRPEGDRKVEHYIAETAKNVLNAFDNQDYQFEMLVEKVAPRRQLNRNPLFDVLFALQNYDRTIAVPMEEGNPIRVVPFSYRSRVSKFDLTLQAFQLEEGVRFRLDYRASLFKEETVRRMGDHFINLLRGVVENPGAKLWKIPIMLPGEKERVLNDFNRTRRPYPEDKTIHQLFREQAEKTPHKIAVVEETHTHLTYRELDRLSDAVAAHLAGKGIQPGGIVPLATDRSVEMLTGLLGILKSGCAYLPIDPSQPEDRQQYMLADANARLKLTRNDIDIIETTGPQPDSTASNLFQPATRNAQPATSLCYIIYTSGSTGRPKGVMVEHRSVVRLVKNTNYIDFSTPGRILQTGALDFDASTFEIWGALLNGWTLHLEKKETILNTPGLRDILLKQKITAAWMTAPLFNHLCDEDIHLFAPLRYLLAGGDVLSPSHINRLRTQFPHIKIINGYGPTENTTFSTTFQIDIDHSHNIPIGKPIANSTVYILNTKGQPVPIGVPGELIVGGDGVARGYLNNPELTAQKFITPNSKFKIQNSKLYKSGDLCRWLPDGNIQFLGRIDQQVKIRGFRIEPGEIENRLLKIPGMEKCLVTVHQDENSEKSLCGYFTASQKIDSAEIRQHIAGDLPDYMIPAYLIQLGHFPLTPRGKIDRRALPAPGTQLTGKRTAPTNQTEEALSAIWSQVLGVAQAQIGINDNFFELGGHSLKATILGAKIHQTFNVKIALSDIFVSPVLRDMALHIRNAAAESFTAVEPVEEKEYYPLSSAQKRLYLLDQFDNIGTSYNIPTALTLQGPLDKNKLEETFKYMIRRHENLRTSFHMIHDKPVQRIHKEVAFQIEDLNTSGVVEPDELLRSFLRPFDLSEAPLLRAGLASLDDGSHFLVIDMHHIISDGTSHAIMTREFEALSRGETLPAMRLQYKDYAHWHNHPQNKELLKPQEDFWLRQTQGELPVLNLPYDFKRPQVQQFEGDLFSFQLSVQQTQSFRDLASSTGTTVYMVILAIFNILISKLGGIEDILIGTPVAGRRHADLENIIGMFVNTLVLRNYPTGDKSFREFLLELKDRTLDAFENQEYPFEDLVDRLAEKINRDTGRNPLFDIVFSYRALEPGQRAGFKEDRFIKVSKFDITLFALESDETIDFDIEYSTRLFKPQTIQRFATYFQNIFTFVLADPSVLLSQIDYIPQDELHDLLHKFNDTDAGYPQDKTVHGLFEDQASRLPGAVALVDPETNHHMTYRQLNRRADHLAASLRGRGVVPGTIIALLLKPSPEMLIAILGTLKSGGAYLPMDPDYPEERIQYMLSDSNSSLLLTIDDINPELNSTAPNLSQPATRNSQPATNLCYIIYTSGTTGKPKGTIIEHRNVVRLLFNDRNLFDFTYRDTWTLFHSYCFDFSVWEMYGALLYGGKLIIIPRTIARDTVLFLETLKKQNVTVLNQTPGAFYNLSNCESDHPRRDLHIRYIVFGGEALTPARLRDWYHRYPTTRLINMYGITETTVHVTFKEIGEKEITDNISNIGVPIPTLKTYILDKYLNPVPVGVPGELIVAGHGVGRGYLNRPELTHEKFVNSKFKIQNSKLYKSGDLARWNSDGEMEYLGRIDSQVKIRGYRIELGEIENRITRHPDIKEAVVLAKNNPTGEKYLCAYYIVPAGSQPVPPEQYARQLTKHLSQTLPDYMIPGHFIPLHKIPLTSNGKVDRSQLPDPVPAVQGDIHIPTDETQTRLAQTWAHVLGIEAHLIGTDANFFEMGGNSLNAISLVNAVHKTFNIKISLQSVFLSPILSQMAALIRENTVTPFIEITPLPVREHYQLSYTQKRLWVLQKRTPDSCAFNMPEKYTLNKKIDPDRLQQALKSILERHESLRTYFDESGGMVVQKILSHVEPQIHFVDLSHLETQEQQTERKQLLTQESAIPFDPGKPPLLRVKLVKCREEEYDLIFTLHHLISDGWSQVILRNEFMMFYDALENNQTANPPGVSIQYKDYAHWHNRLLEDETRLRGPLEFWKNHLTPAPSLLQLPYNVKPAVLASQPHINIKESTAYHTVIDAGLTQKLRTLARQRNASMFMLLTAVFFRTLHRLRGQQDLLIGLPGAARQHDDLKNTIGCFVNTLVLRSQIDTEESFSDYLERTRLDILDVLNYQGFPLELMFEKLNIPYPEFNLFFNMLNMGGGPLETMPQIPTGHVPGVQEGKFQLEFYLNEFKDGISIECIYYSQMFRPGTIETMTRLFTQLLEQAVQAPDKPLKDSGQKKKKKLTRRKKQE